MRSREFAPARFHEIEIRGVLDRNFVEIYVKASLETSFRPDVKGMYKKALRGELKNFTGIDDLTSRPPARNS